MQNTNFKIAANDNLTGWVHVCEAWRAHCLTLPLVGDDFAAGAFECGRKKIGVQQGNPAKRWIVLAVFEAQNGVIGDTRFRATFLRSPVRAPSSAMTFSSMFVSLMPGF